MAVEADMAWVVDPAASFGERRRDVAPVGLGGKDDDVVQSAALPAISSRAFWLVAYPSQSHEMLFDAHTRAFAAFGGIPRRGI